MSSIGEQDLKQAWKPIISGANLSLDADSKLLDGMQLLACYLRPWLTYFALTDVAKANAAMVHFQDL